MDTQRLINLDKQHLWHPFTHMSLWLDDPQPLVIVAGEGCELIDSGGRRYLDGISSLWCNVHGHRVREIDDAIRTQLDRIAHTTQLGLSNDVAIELAERLVSITPPGLSKVLYASDGASSTEMAFKLAAQYWWNLGKPEKHEFIGFVDAYHGDTVGAMSVGHSEAFHRPYAPLLFKTHYVSGEWGVGSGEARTATNSLNSTLHTPHSTLARVEDVLRAHANRIAAICVEPMVMGAAGMIVQPPGFVRGLRDLATKYDVLLIADEVATGFGRTGKMFACEHEGVSPDLLCLGKGLTGGYLPLSATLASQRIFDAFLGAPHEGKTFFHGHTFAGNPLACAAALANLKLFETNQSIENANRLAEVIAKRLTRLRSSSPHVAATRQCGLMVGIDLVQDRTPNQKFDPRLRVGANVCRKIRDSGVILRPLGDTLVVMPPLAMSVEQVERVFDAIELALTSIVAGIALASEGPHKVVAGDF
ncbi:MAG: adenosylmethionine--8-amino-7-oxononanoate transaminase [Tepidisphaeraceae bacterium]